MHGLNWEEVLDPPDEGVRSSPHLKNFSSLFAALTNLFFAEPTRFDVFVTGERIDFVWQNDSRCQKVRVNLG